MGVHVFPWNPLSPPSPSHPSGSSQCISPEHSVSCIEPGLAIRFTYENICFNAILPNHPTLASPTESKDCSIHLCLFCCLACRVIIPIFLNSIYICVVILYWCFSFWFTSLYIIGSSFILGSLFSTGIPVPFCLSERLSKIRNWIWSSFLSNFCFCIWFGRVWNFARTL